MEEREQILLSSEDEDERFIALMPPIREDSSSRIKKEEEPEEVPVSKESRGRKKVRKPRPQRIHARDFVFHFALREGVSPYDVIKLVRTLLSPAEALATCDRDAKIIYLYLRFEAKRWVNTYDFLQFLGLGRWTHGASGRDGQERASLMGMIASRVLPWDGYGEHIDFAHLRTGVTNPHEKALCLKRIKLCLNVSSPRDLDALLQLEGDRIVLNLDDNGLSRLVIEEKDAIAKWGRNAKEWLCGKRKRE